MLTLYAHWTTNITFNANGGTLTGGFTDEERALNGRTSGTIQISVGQNAATGLTATKSGYEFVEWNTNADGSGKSIAEYGAVTGPVTFYASYYQRDYYFTGNYQTFTAPVDGVYTLTAYGGSGAGGYGGSTAGVAGASVSGDITLHAGDTIYVYVGGQGSLAQPGSSGASGGWNGGGSTGANTYNNPAHNHGGGGGATDFRLISGTWSDTTSLNSRIMVAAGGGGYGAHGVGGIGGTTNGSTGGGQGHPNYNGGYGASLTSGGADGGTLGIGGNGSTNAGGGGGGYYGGGSAWYSGAGGGSSYISGYNACPVHYSGYTFTNASWSAGTSQSGPGGKNGFARILLKSLE